MDQSSKNNAFFFDNDFFQKMKKKFINWSLLSTSHGYPKIFYSKNRIIKLMWTLFFIIFTLICAYMIVQNIQEYYEYGVITKWRIVHDKSMAFPAISICNLNKYATMSAIEYIEETFLQELNVSLINPSSLLEKSLDLRRINQLLELISLRIAHANFSTDRKKSFGLGANEMFLSCTFNTIECDLDELEWFYDTTFGNCFRFNSGYNLTGGSIALKTSNRYSLDGLSLVLFTGMSNVNTQILDLFGSSGIRIVIHDQQTRPIVHNEGLDIKAGTKNRISLSKKLSQYLPSPYSECDDLGELDSDLVNKLKATNFKYRHIDCFNLCLQMVTINACSCYDLFFMNLFPHIEPCLNQTQIDCMTQSYLKFKRNDHLDDTCHAMCPIECEKIDFETRHSFSNFLPKNPVASFNSRRYLFDNFNFSRDEIEAFIGLNIFYDEIQFIQMTQQPSVTFPELLGNVGGTLGLFIGISFLSFLEVLEILIEISYLTFKSYFSKKADLKEDLQVPTNEVRL
jgi:hypothetical protein